jgi:hypothetical protein
VDPVTNTNAQGTTAETDSSPITTQTLGMPADPTFIYGSVGDTFSGTESADKSTPPDIFAYANGATGNDVINSFNVSQDMVQFDHTQFANLGAVNAATTYSGGNTVIHLNATDSITLTQVDDSSLTASNFRFV